ncbi:twin-arginine translocase subunit TatC [Pseudonocardia nantongensis]|uniref:twin-arginine translocase subunit TatC n=1 Tax=Pseudonocardia nantongensis TaxID=1181885 RepID=UPI00397B1E86
MLRLKVGATAGVVLAAPVWLWQVWRFVVPALRRGERRYAVAFVTVSTLLFVAGAYLASTIAPQGLGFLLTIGDEVQTTALTGQSYFAFVLALLLVFGISFELPLLVVALNLVGVLPHATLTRCRRGIVFGLFIFAAIATPGQDPISMLALAAALVLLFELAVLVARVHDARVRRRTAPTPEDLDTSSEIDTTPSPLP